MKKLKVVLASLVILGILSGCSNPEEKAAEYLTNGDLLFAENNFDKAAIEYKNALQVNQNLPDAWYGLARIHEQKQEWKQAYGVLNKIREMNPNHVEARIMLGQLLATSDMLDQALVDAKEIMELAPDDVRSLALMAAVQYRLQNYKAAQLYVDKALALDSSNLDALLVRVRILIAEKRYDDALTWLDDAISKDRENISFYLIKIQVYTELEDRPAIEKVYLALIDQFPANVNFKQALARHYIDDKNIDAAGRIMQQIAESGGGDTDDKLRFVVFKSQYRSLDDSITLLKSYIDGDKGEYRYRFLLAELYEKSEQADKAVAVYKKIITDDGTQTNGLEARNKMAVIELLAGNRAQAVALTNEVLEQDQNNENALLMQASFQIIDGKLDDAIVSARTVLRVNPDSIKGVLLLGQAYDKSGSQELAIESYTTAFQLSPGTPAIANKLAAYMLLQGKAAQADEILQKSMISGNRSVDALRLYAQTKLALGEWDMAEQLVRQLQEVEGQESTSQQLLGVIFLGKGQQEASIEAFKRAHELAPDDSQPVVSLVRTYARSGKLDEARQFLNSILEVDDDNVTAHMLLGELSVTAGDSSEAIIHFSAAIRSNPDLVEGYRRLALVYSSRNEKGMAEETIKKAMVAIPDDSALPIHLAAIYEGNGDFEKAIEVYQAVLAKDDDSLIARNNLAGLLTDHRSDQDSFDMARKVSADLKNSKIPQMRDTYAWALVVAGGNLEEAVVILEGLVRENEQVDVYTYHLGEAYRRKGDSKNAIVYLEKAVKLAGEDSEIAKDARQSLQQLQ